MILPPGKLVPFFIVVVEFSGAGSGPGGNASRKSQDGFVFAAATGLHQVTVGQNDGLGITDPGPARRRLQRLPGVGGWGVDGAQGGPHGNAVVVLTAHHSHLATREHSGTEVQSVPCCRQIAGTDSWSRHVPDSTGSYINGTWVNAGREEEAVHE